MHDAEAVYNVLVYIVVIAIFFVAIPLGVRHLWKHRNDPVREHFPTTNSATGEGYGYHGCSCGEMGIPPFNTPCVHPSGGGWVGAVASRESRRWSTPQEFQQPFIR